MVHLLMLTVYYLDNINTEPEAYQRQDDESSLLQVQAVRGSFSADNFTTIIKFTKSQFDFHCHCALPDNVNDKILSPKISFVCLIYK